jgi:hypothetical protein
MEYFTATFLNSSSAYESVDAAGNSLFYDALGNIVVVSDKKYLTRSWVPNTARLPWMQPATTPPPQSLVLSKIDFLQRFTTPERIAIRQAAKANVYLEDYMELLNSAITVDLSHASTITGLQMFEQFNLIGVGRANQILGVL